jgi:hypothetical protein
VLSAPRGRHLGREAERGRGNAVDERCQLGAGAAVAGTEDLLEVGPDESDPVLRELGQRGEGAVLEDRPVTCHLVLEHEAQSVRDEDDLHMVEVAQTVPQRSQHDAVHEHGDLLVAVGKSADLSGHRGAHLLPALRVAEGPHRPQARTVLDIGPDEAAAVVVAGGRHQGVHERGEVAAGGVDARADRVQGPVRLLQPRHLRDDGVDLLEEPVDDACDAALDGRESVDGSDHESLAHCSSASAGMSSAVAKLRSTSERRRIPDP